MTANGGKHSVAKRGLFLEGASLVLMELPMADPRKERRE